MLSEFKQFVKSHSSDIILIAAVVLISLFSFAAGYLAGRYQSQEPIIIESTN